MQFLFVFISFRKIIIFFVYVYIINFVIFVMLNCHLKYTVLESWRREKRVAMCKRVAIISNRKIREMTIACYRRDVPPSRPCVSLISYQRVGPVTKFSMRVILREREILIIINLYILGNIECIRLLDNYKKKVEKVFYFSLLPSYINCT